MSNQDERIHENEINTNTYTNDIVEVKVDKDKEPSSGVPMIKQNVSQYNYTVREDAIGSDAEIVHNQNAN